MEILYTQLYVSVPFLLDCSRQIQKTSLPFASALGTLVPISQSFFWAPLPVSCFGLLLSSGTNCPTAPNSSPRVCTYLVGRYYCYQPDVSHDGNGSRK